jgi:hypothetical protein
MRHAIPGWVLSTVSVALLACPGPATDPRPQRPRGASRAGSETPRRAAARIPPRWVESICDRVEDCAVERNVRLAKRYGGSPADIAAARREAQQALVSGVVRRWCLMRVGRLQRSEVKRIHQCLAKRACALFYQCAAFPRARARPRPTARRSPR